MEGLTGMTPTTEYGTWNNYGDKGNETVEASIIDAINGGEADWCERVETTGALGRMAAAYRSAINDALPEGVVLFGNEFIGPYAPAAGQFDGYPADEDGDLDIHAIVEGIDLASIIEQHDPDGV